jgi:hypothetical protein
MSWDVLDPLFRDRRPVRAEVMLRCQRKFPWVPEDYWSFLRDVGDGTFGPIRFYGGLAVLEDFNVRDGPAGFVAFGDNFAGTFYGLHPNYGARVVLVDMDDRRLIDCGTPFTDWVKGLGKREPDDE